MLNFLTKLTEYFLKLVGSLDADGSGGIDFNVQNSILQKKEPRKG